jgi:hypothetical protein
MGRHTSYRADRTRCCEITTDPAAEPRRLNSIAQLWVGKPSTPTEHRDDVHIRALAPGRTSTIGSLDLVDVNNDIVGKKIPIYRALSFSLWKIVV